MLELWNENTDVNIVSDETFCQKYEVQFDAAKLDARCATLDAKIKQILAKFHEMVKNGDFPFGAKEGVKALFSAHHIFRRDFYFEFEFRRLKFCNNLLTSW